MSWENILKDSSQSTWAKLLDEGRNLKKLRMLIGKLSNEKMIRELPKGEKTRSRLTGIGMPVELEQLEVLLELLHKDIKELQEDINSGKVSIEDVELQ